MEKILEPKDKNVDTRDPTGSKKKGKKKKKIKKCNKKCRKRKICKKKRKEKGSNKRKGCWKKRKTKKKKKNPNKNQNRKEKKKKGGKRKVKKRRGRKKKKKNFFRSRSVIQPLSKNMFRSSSVKIPRKVANKKPEMLHEVNESIKNSSFPLDQPKNLTSFQTDSSNKSNDLPEVKIKSDKRRNKSQRNKIIPQLLFSHIIKLHNILRDHANNSTLHNHEPEEIISSGSDPLNEAKVVAKMKEKNGYDWKHIQRR